MKSAVSQQATQRSPCRVQIQTSNCPAQEGLEFDVLQCTQQHHGLAKEETEGRLHKQAVTNLWVLHIEGSESQAPPTGLLHICGPKWSSPITPDVQDSQHSVPQEPQRTLGNMGLKLLESRLCLLLLLGLVLMLASCQ